MNFREKGYSFDSIVNDLEVVFKKYASKNNVVIAHALGASYCISLSSRMDLIDSLVLVSPTTDGRCGFPWWCCPISVVDALRRFDVSGGTTSRFIARNVHPEANDFVRSLLLRLDERFPSSVLRSYASNIRANTEEEVTSVESTLLLVTGEADLEIPVARVTQLYEQWRKFASTPEIIPESGHYVMLERREIFNAIVCRFLTDEAHLESMSERHQLLRTPSAQEGKWSLKNFEKWAATPNVGKLVGPTRLRPMKVMRQNDPEHSPESFAAKYPKVALVVDLSHSESPYMDSDPHIKRYIKLSTVSKSLPDPREVEQFIKVVDSFFQESKNKDEIAVHCHYGFNRTGFMICAYLVERQHLTITDAINMFATARPPGIKHQYFKDELILRYALNRHSSSQQHHT